MGVVITRIKNSGTFGLKLFFLIMRAYYLFHYFIRSDEKAIIRRFKLVFGYMPDLSKPKTLNEKLQWLKLNERKDFHTIHADKFTVRKFIGDTFGEDLLIPLLYKTTNWRDINIENINKVPCVIKSNHDSGGVKIIRDLKDINWNKIRTKCKYWLSLNYYYISRQWQYKNIKNRIIMVEELLLTKKGKIPHDFKLHFINGVLNFIYVSYDREGVNDRCIYDCNWNRLNFMWIEKENFRQNMNTSIVPKPASFDRMVEIGSKISKEYKYVRVDFYDVDGKLYFGEITHHHGGGFDLFFPENFDLIYGEKLSL